MHNSLWAFLSPGPQKLEFPILSTRFGMGTMLYLSLPETGFSLIHSLIMASRGPGP